MRDRRGTHTATKKHTHTAELGLTVYWRGGKRSVVIGFIIIHFDLTLCPNERLEAQPRNLLCQQEQQKNRMIRQFSIVPSNKSQAISEKKRPKTFALCVPPRVDSNYVTTPPLHTHRTGFEEEG